MFSAGLLSLPNASQQREAVRVELLEQINSGTFTYTELLSSKEPFRTMALEILDGVTVNQSIPTYGGGSVQTWGNKTFRLVHVDPTGRIKVPTMKDVRVPGAMSTKQEKHWEDLGNIADVNDYPHDRQARYVLRTKGWPVLQTVTNGNSVGTVVEWEWLVQEAARGAAARPDCVELHASIAKRIEAWEASKAAAAEAEAASKKAAKKQTQTGGDPARV